MEWERVLIFKQQQIIVFTRQRRRSRLRASCKASNPSCTTNTFLHDRLRNTFVSIRKSQEVRGKMVTKGGGDMYQEPEAGRAKQVVGATQAT